MTFMVIPRTLANAPVVGNPVEDSHDLFRTGWDLTKANRCPEQDRPTGGRIRPLRHRSPCIYRGSVLPLRAHKNHGQSLAEYTTAGGCRLTEVLPPSNQRWASHV